MWQMSDTLNALALKQEEAEHKLEIFKATGHYNELIEEEFKRALLDENIFWEAFSYDGHCGYSEGATHEKLVKLIVNKDDAALGKEIRLWIEDYLRDSVQNEVEEKGVEEID